MKQLCFDCETSGINPEKHGPLTAYFGLWDENGNFIDELYLFMKPDPGYVIEHEEEAYKVTGINYEQHCANPNTITYSQAKLKLLEFLTKHKIKGKRRHFRPLGQNIKFDLDMLFSHIISKDEWQKVGVHYRQLDTVDIVTFLQDVGVLPSYLGRLHTLVEYFNIPKQQYHDAKGDVHMTMNVYKRLRDMVKNKFNSGVSSNIDQDLLEIIER